MNARALSDNLASLLRREHSTLAEFLVALADFDRKLRPAPAKLNVTAPSEQVRTVPASAVPAPEHETSRDAGSPVESGSTVEPTSSCSGPLRVPAVVPPRRSAELVPLTAEQRRLHVTVSAAFARKLEQARAARPDLPDEALLDAGLDLLLAQSAKRKGLVERPRKTPPSSKTNHIPAHVKREVWKRDGGRCGFRPGELGARGGTRAFTLLHRPYESTPLLRAVRAWCMGGA